MKDKNWEIYGIYLGLTVGSDEEHGRVIVGLRDARTSMGGIGDAKIGDRVRVRIERIDHE